MNKPDAHALITHRGEFFMYASKDCVDCIEVFLGRAEDAESDHVLLIHKHYIPSLIAVLKSSLGRV